MSVPGKLYRDDLGVSDQIVLIYTWVVLSVVCQIINLFGIVTNIINIICFLKQGFQDSVSISLLGLSISDLGCLVTMAWSCLSVTPAFLEADLPLEPLEVSYLASAMPHFAFTRVSSCITAMITLERCCCIIAPLKIKSIITPKRTAAMTVCIFILFMFTAAPIYVVNRLDMKFSPGKNKTIFGLVFVGDRENVEKVCLAINNFVIPFVAFFIIAVSTILLSFKLQKITEWRNTVASITQVDRVSSRNQKIAKMVVMISTLFIVCFIPMSIIMLVLGLIPSLSILGKHMKITIMIGGLSFILESINSSMNIFIYYNMSSKYRDQFQRVFHVCKNDCMQHTSKEGYN